MNKKLGLVVFAAILFVGLLFATGCSRKSANASPVLEPHRTEVYFLIQNTRNCSLLVYVPEGSVCVSVKVDSGVTEPYVEVPRMINEYNEYLGPLGQPYVDWHNGGKLYVNNVKQVKDLLLVQ